MKKLLILITLLTGLSSVAQASIDIRGFYIGMDKKEAKAHWKAETEYDWMNAGYFTTIGGVKTASPAVGYNDNKKVDHVQWAISYSELDCQTFFTGACYTYSVQTFVNVVELLQEKFGEFDCKESIWQNAFGKQATNRECIFRDGKGSLIRTVRYHYGNQYGVISLTSEASYNKWLNDKKLDSNDL